MARVELTRHLFEFFPTLAGRDLVVEAETARDVVLALERLAPGFAFYVCDERGVLRQHVNLFIERERVRDRATLTDAVPAGARVSILQALSGG